MKRFQHQVIELFLDTGEIERTLNTHGSEGWELVSVLHFPENLKRGQQGDRLVVLMKKEVGD